MRTCVAVCVLGAWLAPGRGFAFTVETFASDGCHERITRQALAVAGWPRGENAPAPSEQDAALINAVLFGGAEDPWELALLIGVRYNDFGSAGMGDLAELAAIHNGDQNQAAHCLRSPADDGSAGDVQALEQCRAFILSELSLAQGADQQIDLTATENVTVALAFETAQVTVSRYAFHMGRALHALQDGFSHSFRSDDGHQVVAVFNYVDPALSGDYDPARDGPPHRSDLDHCAAETPPDRVSDATTASAALLGAMDGAGSSESRLEGTQRVLQTWLSYEPGCDQQNGWCGHLGPLATGCGAAPTGSALPVVSLMTAALLAFGRRRHRVCSAMSAVAMHRTSISRLVPVPNRQNGLSRAVHAVVAAILLFGGAPASAAEDSPPSAAPVPVPLGSLRLIAGLTLDRASANVGMGAERAFTPTFRVGVEAEYNPWFELQSMTAAPGVVNASSLLTVVWGHPSGWEVQSGLRLGGSMLLFTLPGARAGSFGVFFGASPIRVVVPVAPGRGLELSPDIAVAVPSLGGVPLVYRQYRFSVGYRWDV